MKKLTEQEVFNQLVNNSSAECEEMQVRYYLHITEDGEIVNDYSSADITFMSDIPYWCYTDNLNEFYNIEDLFSDKYENAEWLPFMQLVEELTFEANNWLASIGA